MTSTGDGRQGVSAVVAKHYNELQERGLEARKESRIFYMRSFNNWIKSMLISDIIKRLDKRDLVVLDMCCGKGGDIQKWVKSNAVRHVVFADIAETSVAQCMDRYRNLNNNQRYQQGYQRYRRFNNTFSAEFITADCTKETLRDKYSDAKIQFDLVSVQFSFHYSFESLPQATKMLQNISENLAPGGYFVGTTPNANRIVKKLLESGTNEFGNEVFHIHFDSDYQPIPIFGAKYTFHLDEVVDCPEFLVNFPAFERLAERHGLKLVYKYTFDEYFGRMISQGHFLLERMQALQTYPSPSEPPLTGPEYAHAAAHLDSLPSMSRLGTLSQSEWETVSLYVVFAFQKVE